MNFREEIEEYLHNIEPHIKSLLDKDIHVWNIQVTNDIVSMIEKRIDSRIEHMNSNALENRKTNPYIKEYCEGLEWVKKEMLK